MPAVLEPAAPPAPVKSVITASRRALVEAVGHIARVTSSQTSLPVLKNILLKPDENEVILAGTDLELGLEMTLPAECRPGDGLTLPAKVLGEIVSALPAEDVRIEIDPEKQRAVVTSGKSRFEVAGLTAEDFPALGTVENPKSFTLTGGQLRSALKQVTCAVSDDDTRPILTGVFIGTKDGALRFAATEI